MFERSDKGLIQIEAEYQSEERALMDGYSYGWEDETLHCTIMVGVANASNVMPYAKVVGYV